LAVVPELAAGHRSAAVAAVKADLPVADIRDNTEAANSSKVEVEADKAGVCLEVHTICNNRNPTPNTSPLRLVSKSTGNIHNSIVRRRPRSASF
jgi:hypothetical protein